MAEAEEELCASLGALGLSPMEAEDVARACRTPAEAEQLAACLIEDGGRLSRKGGWREWFSIREQRCYYRCDDTGENGWEPPLLFSFKEWQLDSQTYDIPISEARRLFEVVKAAVSAEPFIGGGRPLLVQGALRVLTKVIGNVVRCGNSEAKYRTVKKTNRVIADSVLAVPGAEEILQAAGFRLQADGEAYCLPPESTDLRHATCLLARLERLRDNKGHTGDATVNHDLPKEGEQDSDGNTMPPLSPFSGQPGFRYQTNIYHCSECDRPIPDGSERVWTGRHDSPAGEFRYECTECTSPPYSLCEGCWDRHTSGSALHDGSHQFQTHHPITSRHNPANHQTDRNPWGLQRGDGAAASRAYERLVGRVGYRHR